MRDAWICDYLRTVGVPNARACQSEWRGNRPGHPLGASSARLVGTTACELRRRKARYALCTMCIGVGQGIALALEAA